MFFVDIGPGVNYSNEDIVKRLGTLGLRKGGWVVLRNNPVSEKGCGVLVTGLKYVGVRIEVEDDGMKGTPGWFPSADRWLVDYREPTNFNFGSLRARQDILVYKGEDVVGFLGKTSKLQCLRAVIVKDRSSVWDIIKDYEVRVYEDE